MKHKENNKKKSLLDMVKIKNKKKLQVPNVNISQIYTPGYVVANLITSILGKWKQVTNSSRVVGERKWGRGLINLLKYPSHPYCIKYTGLGTRDL